MKYRIVVEDWCIHLIGVGFKSQFRLPFHSVLSRAVPMHSVVLPGKNNNHNNNTTTMFMVLSSCCSSIARDHPGSRDECSTAPGGCQPLDQADWLEP